MENRISVNYAYAPFPRVEEVILTQAHRGAGKENDPCRTVTQVHHKDGGFIAENDDWINVEKLRSRLARAEGLLTRATGFIDEKEALRDEIERFFMPEPL